MEIRQLNFNNGRYTLPDNIDINKDYMFSLVEDYYVEYSEGWKYKIIPKGLYADKAVITRNNNIRMYIEGHILVMAVDQVDIFKKGGIPTIKSTADWLEKNMKNP